MGKNTYKVFIKTDEQGRVTGINSSAFLETLDGWIEVAEGIGDKYHHAQGNYLSYPLFDDRGIANYTFKNGAIFLRDELEMDAEAAQRPHIPSYEERIKMLEDFVENITAVLKSLNILK